MFLDSPIDECRVLAALLIILSAAAIYFRWRSQLLLTGVSGLHVNIFLFFGLGPLAYTFADLPPGRVDPLEIFIAMSHSGTFMLIGYVSALLLDWRYVKRYKGERISNTNTMGGSAAYLGFLVAALSIVGYWGATQGFATSGVGTIFPVLKMFQYPMIILSVLNLERGRPSSALLLLLIFITSGFLAVFSPWRSELILLGFSFCCALTLRNKRWLLPSVIMACLAMLILLPFQQEKKVNYIEVSADPLRAFTKSLDVPLEERWGMVISFWGERINGAREVAYVENAMDKGSLATRGGVTYWEAVQQLVPRVLWSAKPSFNQTTNYLLPREIGLLGWEDPDSSWSVSFYGELVWNFGSAHLIWAVPLAFLFVINLDRLTSNLFKRPLISWLITTALFYQFFSIVSLVFAVTYILWLVLVGYALGIFFGAQLGSTTTAVRPAHRISTVKS